MSLHTYIMLIKASLDNHKKFFFKDSRVSKMSSNQVSSELPSPYSLADLHKIIQVQKNTIDKLMSQVTRKAQAIPREQHEKLLNELETERYEHSKTKLELLEYKDVVNSQRGEVEFFKNELEKERSAYANV